MDQNKKRIFDCEKNEYTFRTLKSLINSVNIAKKNFPNSNFEIIITDTNSSEKDLATGKKGKYSQKIYGTDGIDRIPIGNQEIKHSECHVQGMPDGVTNSSITPKDLEQSDRLTFVRSGSDSSPRLGACTIYKAIGLLEEVNGKKKEMLADEEKLAKIVKFHEGSNELINDKITILQKKYSKF